MIIQVTALSREGVISETQEQITNFGKKPKQIKK